MIWDLCLVAAVIGYVLLPLAMVVDNIRNRGTDKCHVQEADEGQEQ